MENITYEGFKNRLGKFAADRMGKPGGFIDRKTQQISNTDPNNFQPEQLAQFFHIPVRAAKFIMDMAVREGQFVKTDTGYALAKQEVGENSGNTDMKPKFKNVLIKKNSSLVREEVPRNMMPREPQNYGDDGEDYGNFPQEPEQCDNCAAYRKEGENGSTIKTTTDQGNAETGPTDFEVYDAWICDDCTNYKEKFGKLPRVDHNEDEMFKYAPATRDLYRSKYGEDQEITIEDFATVSESLLTSIPEFKEGYWYEMLNPRYEYRGNNKRQKIIALPPSNITGKLFESPDGRHVRLQNRIDDTILAQYGMRKVVVERT